MARRDGRLIVFIDDSGLSERPTRVRTWAPKGQTPIIQFHFNWTHISVSAGPSRTNCLFRVHEGSIKKQQHVGFQKALRAHLKRPLPIIRDGLKAHRRKLVREYLDSTDGAVQMAFLPPYSPDLNPVECLWAWLKRHALANFCPAKLDEINVTARRSSRRAGFKPGSGNVIIYGNLNGDFAPDRFKLGFQVTAVPEPQTHALQPAGLGLIAARLKRGQPRA
jgi:transposase